MLLALDGRHIRIECPKNSGTLYYNYKGFFSIVLLAIYDANYCFTMYDLGQMEATMIFECAKTPLFQHIQKWVSALKKAPFVPDESDIEGTETFELPYYLVGDEIFPLNEWLIRPYPGPLVEDATKIFNYRLSKARRTIKNALEFYVLVGEYFKN